MNRMNYSVVIALLWFFLLPFSLSAQKDCLAPDSIPSVTVCIEDYRSSAKTTAEMLNTIIQACWIGGDSVPDAPRIHIQMVPLAPGLYVDGTQIPPGFDAATLIRLNELLKAEVIPNCRTPYPEHIRRLPVILRYVPFSEAGHYPATTEGYGGWCDVVFVDWASCSQRNCTLDIQQSGVLDIAYFLALVAVPDASSPDYLAELWGFTAHEIAHAYGAVDGPRCPFYEDDHLLAPIAPVSDTYYWFGIAHLFKPGYHGIVWDAWHDACRDELCERLRCEVFNLDEAGEE